ncbi:MAG: hypothetical protein OEY86_08965, partial [Nitrospira sp.]|nr:hypothetical protein [Nitrospira sp.]
NYEGQALYSFEVVATDGAGNTSTQVVSLAITNVDEVPSGTDGTVSVTENASLGFMATDFGFTDPDAGDSLSAVRIDGLTLPAGASLRLSGVDVVSGDVIAVGQLGSLVFAPAANTSGVGYASFTFSVRDTGGPAFDPTPNTLTINVTAAAGNSIPVISVNFGSQVTQGLTDVITPAELNIVDANNAPEEVRYTVISTPVYGRLELSTMPGLAITTFTQADINAGRLLYVHNGAVSTSDQFIFTVSDGAGGSIGATTFTVGVSPFAPQSADSRAPILGARPALESGLRLESLILPRPSVLSPPRPVWIRDAAYSDALGTVAATEDSGSRIVTASSAENEGDEGTVGSPPVNTVPGEQMVTRGSSVTLSGISVADGDGDLATVQIRVINGTITVMLAGEASIVGGASGTAVLTLSGSQDEVNATLSTLTYHASKDDAGPDTLTVISTDRKRLSDISIVTITVMSEKDEPADKDDGSGRIGRVDSESAESVNGHEARANLFGGVVLPAGASLSGGLMALVARLVLWRKRRKRESDDKQDGRETLVRGDKR